MQLRIVGSDDTIDLSHAPQAEVAGATLYRAPDGRWIAPAFGGYGVALTSALPDTADDAALADLVLEWVQAVRSRDWSDVRGAPLEADGDWIDLRTAMVRVGWGPQAAQQAWERARERPYAHALPTAAGWAGAGWVVPAAADDPAPAFARPVLEARGLLRWAYITRWQQPAPLPEDSLPREIEPQDPDWIEVQARLRQDHYTHEALAEAEELAVEVLVHAGLGPRSPIEAEDDPLPDRDVAPACTHPSPVVRTAAWFLLRAEADEWLACAYAECSHHWAVEAEEDAYEVDEVLELAGHGVTNPVDAARTRRRLLTLAFGSISDVPLAGAGDLPDFISFYEDWVAHGRPEEMLDDAARALRGDDGEAAT